MIHGDDHGVNVTVRESALASILDSPPRAVTRHYMGQRASRTLCGAPADYVTESHYSTTCEVCLAAIGKRLAKAQANNETRRTLRKVGAALRRESVVASSEQDVHAEHRRDEGDDAIAEECADRNREWSSRSW